MVSETVKKMAILAAADPDTEVPEAPFNRLSPKECAYIEFLMSHSKHSDGRSGLRGAFIHMNSEDASSERQLMSEGNVVLWKPNTRVTADMFPARFFGHIMASKVPHEEGLSLEDYHKRLGELNRIPHEHAQQVSMGVRERSLKSGHDSKSWTATLGSGSSMTGIYVEKHGPGLHDVWVVTHVNHSALSAEFWAWLNKFCGKKGATLEDIMATRAYSDTRELARRNALRVHHRTAAVMGIKSLSRCGGVPDIMAKKDDPREDTPMLAVPDIHNTYNVFRRDQVVQFQPAGMFLNKSTSLEESKGGVVLLTSPARDIRVYPFSPDTVYSNGAASTVPICTGRVGHKRDSQSKPPSLDERERRGIENIARRHMIWDGKCDHSGAELSSAAIQDDYRRLTQSRTSLLQDKLGLPNCFISLTPHAVKVSA